MQAIGPPFELAWPSICASWATVLASAAFLDVAMDELDPLEVAIEREASPEVLAATADVDEPFSIVCM